MTTKVDNVVGDVHRHDSGSEDNYSQVTDYWVRVLNEDERNRLVDNIAGHLKNAASFLQERGINNFGKVHPDFGTKLRAALKKLDQVIKRVNYTRKLTLSFFILMTSFLGEFAKKQTSKPQLLTLFLCSLQQSRI